LRVWREFAKDKSHAQMGVGIDDGCWRFKMICFRENFDLDECAVGQRVDGVHVAAGGAEVANAGDGASADDFG
jgi:hypothetical protein